TEEGSTMNYFKMLISNWVSHDDIISCPSSFLHTVNCQSRLISAKEKLGRLKCFSCWSLLEKNRCDTVGIT
ncbi:22302_t:CDS:1, partial [Racocetra persica]